MRDTARTLLLVALLLVAALLPVGCKAINPAIDPLDIDQFRPPPVGSLPGETPAETSATPVKPATPAPAAPVTQAKAFVGPLPWTSWVRTAINGRYRPLGSIYRGKRVRSTGAVYYHQGVDILAPKGTALVAPADGKVVQAGNWDPDGYGIALLMELPGPRGPVYVLYAHLSKLLVRRGEAIKGGDIVARSGISGNASGMRKKEEHVHVEMRTQLQVGVGLAGRIDPLDYFPNVKPPKELRR